MLATATSGELTATDLTPLEQALTLAVTFPDGYQRSLVRSTLIVDDMRGRREHRPALRHLPLGSAPLHPGRPAHAARGSGGQPGPGRAIPETVVQVTVPTPEQGVIIAFERQRLLVVGLGVLIAGSVLALVLIIGGRIRPQAGGRGRKAARAKAAARQRLEKDPVTQPVTISPAGTLAGQARSPFSGWLERLPRHTQPARPSAAGFPHPAGRGRRPSSPAAHSPGRRAGHPGPRPPAGHPGDR